MPPKIRFHKGITSALRASMRKAGMALDEEVAQYVMAGRQVATDPASTVLRRLRHDIHEDRFDLMRKWEADHPGQNAFPPPFPQRVLDKLNEIFKLVDSGEVDAMSVSMMLGDIREMCTKELEDDFDQ